MRVFPRFRSLSRAVHQEQEQEHEEEKNNAEKLSTSLTVWRKSLVMSCKGFTVIDCYGNLVYRVDNYIGRPNEVTLMDASGRSILTMFRRRRLGLLDEWFVYEGEVGNIRRRRSNLSKPSKSPICCVRKNVNILHGNSNVLAYVFSGVSHSDKRHVAFTVEGSYAHRTCKVLDECRRVVAEIKRKEANTKNVSFGIEIFQLVVHSGFDPAFAMALVLLLDQMFS
ncbi:protein LURP-one-related 17-like [Vigna unguiculata]|uniref:Translation initiation factor eIF-2B subunit alpha n=1 Tax=Vigna unguiculata TaxID=3917 RepID=A0A4D6LT75_VIGUN|nr:protein LURP-one-related 17-like [Vigna unguiculata]QCD91690.1 translation initiation factor eIF-2B subunit alpha [Vigna unguiculata]